MKKRKFALEKPKEFQENTYIGTLGELQKIVQDQDDEVIAETKTPEKTIANNPQGKKVGSHNTPQHVPHTPVNGKKVLPKVKRKVDPMHIPIRSEKKPKPVKQEKRKKRGLVWLVICLLFMGCYVVSFEVAKYTFPKSKTTVERLYYPVTTLNKYITILPTMQKFTLSLYKKILGK